jgi:hypothetical protein
MSAEEKQISFYNRYFIFRKNRNINAKRLKNSFLSYAGLQEEQQLASGATETDIALETIALEKIAKASRPIDVASKPAIAARILQEHRDNEVSTGQAKTTTTLKIKPKPKKLTVKASAGSGASAAEEPAPAAPAAAPIEQIEKKIKKRTKKVALSAADSSAEAGAGAVSGGPSQPPPPAVKPKRQTKKKTDL